MDLQDIIGDFTANMWERKPNDEIEGEYGWEYVLFHGEHVFTFLLGFNTETGDPTAVTVRKHARRADTHNDNSDEDAYKIVFSIRPGNDSIRAWCPNDGYRLVDIPVTVEMIEEVVTAWDAILESAISDSARQVSFSPLTVRDLLKGATYFATIVAFYDVNRIRFAE